MTFTTKGKKLTPQWQLRADKKKASQEEAAKRAKAKGKAVRKDDSKPVKNQVDLYVKVTCTEEYKPYFKRLWKVCARKDFLAGKKGCQEYYSVKGIAFCVGCHSEDHTVGDCPYLMTDLREYLKYKV
jgi:hypothetical protein